MFFEKIVLPLARPCPAGVTQVLPDIVTDLMEKKVILKLRILRFN